MIYDSIIKNKLIIVCFKTLKIIKIVQLIETCNYTKRVNTKNHILEGRYPLHRSLYVYALFFHHLVN